MENIYKTKLEEEKRLLEDELGTMGQVDKTGDWKAKPENEMLEQEVPDEGDLADRSEDFEERSSKLNLLELRLTDIKTALEKITNGTYGICEICGRKIEEDRLEVNPAAKTCKECISKVV
ncbi:MAG: TraR/DksA C4-type zinc finger protein [Candidatus Paceibacterota bacterium]